MKMPPPSSLQKQDRKAAKTQRNSNLELYRIICMLLIVAHHYVVNSGVVTQEGALVVTSNGNNSLFLSLFGAWGKTGINCFLMITGYFMCVSKITLQKFLKLILQVYLYKISLFILFYVVGYETLSPLRILKLLMPSWGFSDNFVGCFIVFWLLIPFLSILVQNLTKRQHELLILLIVLSYSVLGSVPSFEIRFNYITWFSIIFLIASYIRLNPKPIYRVKAFWGWMTLSCVTLACMSIVGFRMLSEGNSGLGYILVADCNKIFAVAVAVCSFLWFNNMEMKYSKLINTFGAATFGVLLIHANSEAMRFWLWKDTVDVVGHSALPTWLFALYSIFVVLAIFIICNLIDQLRIATLEKWFFNWYEKYFSDKANDFVRRIITE